MNLEDLIKRSKYREKLLLYIYTVEDVVKKLNELLNYDRVAISCLFLRHRESCSPALGNQVVYDTQTNLFSIGILELINSLYDNDEYKVTIVISENCMTCSAFVNYNSFGFAECSACEHVAPIKEFKICKREEV